MSIFPLSRFAHFRRFAVFIRLVAFGFVAGLGIPRTHAADTPQVFTFDTRFQAANLSQFSASPGNIIDFSQFYGTDWNASSGTVGGYTSGLFGERYGAEFSAQTSGRIGFDVTFRSNSGLLNVDLPNKVSVAVPTNSTPSSPQVLDITQDRSTIGSGNFFETTFPQFQIGLSATMKIDASVTANVAYGFGSAGGTLDLADAAFLTGLMTTNPQLLLGTNPFSNTINILNYNLNNSGKLQILEVPPKDLIGTQGLTVPIQSSDVVKVKGAPFLATLGVVTINPPHVDVNSGNLLTAEGDQPVVLALGLDIPGLIATALGLPFNPLELRVKIPSTPLGVSATLLSVDSNLSLGLKQLVTLDPNTYLGLQSSHPVTYEWLDAGGQTQTTTTTDLLFLLNNNGAANSLTITSLPTDANFTLFPRILVKPKLTNTLTLTAVGFFDIAGGSIGVEGPGGVGGSTPNMFDKHVAFTPSLDIVDLLHTSFVLDSPDLQKVYRFLTPLYGSGTTEIIVEPGDNVDFNNQSGVFGTTSIGGRLNLSNALFVNTKDLTLAGAIMLSGNSQAQFTKLTPTSTGVVSIQGGSSIDVVGAKDSNNAFILDANGKKSVGFVDATGNLAAGQFNLQGAINYDGPDIARIGADAGVLLIASASSVTPGFNNNGVDGLRTLAQIDGAFGLAGAELTLGQSLTNAGKLTVSGGALAINGALTNTGAGSIAIESGGTVTATGAFTNVSSGILSQVDLTLGATTAGTLAYTGGGITELASTAKLTLSGTRPATDFIRASGVDALAGLAINAGTLTLQSGATQSTTGIFSNEHVLEIKDPGSLLAVGGDFGDNGRTTLTSGGALTAGGTLGNISQIDGVQVLDAVDWNLAGPLTYTGNLVQAIGSSAQLTMSGAGNGLIRTGGNAFADLGRIDGSLTLGPNFTLASNATLNVNGTLTVNGAGALASFRGLSGTTGTINVLAGTLDTSGGSAFASYWSDRPTESSLVVNGANQLVMPHPFTMNGTLIYAGPLLNGIEAGTSVTINSTAATPVQTMSGANGLAALSTIDGSLVTSSSLRTDASVTVGAAGNVLVSPGGTLRVTGSTLTLAPGATTSFAGTLALGGNGTGTTFTVPDLYDFNDGGTIELGTPQLVTAGGKTYYDNTGSGRLVAAPGTHWTNTDHRIVGAGEIIGGSFTNSGLIEAGGGTLTLSGFDAPIVNTGTLSSLGTTAHPALLALNSVTLQNGTGGRLIAGSTIALNSSTVTGGSVFVSAGGTLEAFASNLTFDAFRIDGQFGVIDGATTNLTAPVTVTPTGSIVIYSGSSPATLAFGANSSLLNQGLIAFGGGTQITGVTIENRGRMDITAGTTTSLSNIDNTAAGTIHLRDGSTLNLATASFANAGLIHLSGEDPASIPNSSSTFLLTGDLTLTGGGVIQLGGYNFSTTTVNPNHTTTTTSGTTWANAGTGTVRSDNGDHVLTLTSHTLRGQGSLGQGTLSIDNQAGGAIRVEGDGSVLNIETNANGIRNRGSLDVGIGATMNISGGPFLSLANGALVEGSYRVGGTLKIPGLGTHFDTSVAILFDGASPAIVNESNTPATLANILPTGSFTRVNGTTTFNTSFAAPFKNEGLLSAGNGDIHVATPGTIVISGGYFENYVNNTLTGGRYDVAGTLEFVGADILTNAADLTLRAGGQILGGLGLNGLRGFNHNTGSFRLFTGANYVTDAALTGFSNSGLMQLDRSSFTGGSGLVSFSNGGTLDLDFSVLKTGAGGNAGVFSNSGTIDLNHHSTIEVLAGVGAVHNTGSIHVHDGSNFSVKPGVGSFAQNGSVRVGPGAWLDFGTAAVHNSGGNYYIQGRVLGGTSFGGGATRLTLYGTGAQWQVAGRPVPMVNNGTLTFAGGYAGVYDFGYRPINTGLWEVGSSQAIAPDGSTIRSAGSVLFNTLPLHDLTVENTGTLRFYGGARDDGSFGTFKVQGGGRLIMDGGFNAGRFDASGDVTIASGSTLEVRGILAATEGPLNFLGGGAIVVDGGLDMSNLVNFGSSPFTFTHSGNRMIRINQFNFSAPGLDLGTRNHAPISLLNTGRLINSTTGKSALSNLLDNGSTIELDSVQETFGAGDFSNTGTLRTGQSSSMIFQASLTNYGRLEGDGTGPGTGPDTRGDFVVATNLTNIGSIIGGRLNVGGDLINQSAGTLHGSRGTVGDDFINAGVFDGALFLGTQFFTVGDTVQNSGTMTLTQDTFGRTDGTRLPLSNSGTLTFVAGTFSHAFSGGGDYVVAPDAGVTISGANPTLTGRWSVGLGGELTVASDASLGAPPTQNVNAWVTLGANSVFNFSGPLSPFRAVDAGAGATIRGSTTDAAIPAGIAALGDLTLSGHLTTHLTALPSTATLTVSGTLTLDQAATFAKPVAGNGEIFNPGGYTLSFNGGATFDGTIHNPASGLVRLGGSVFAANLDNAGSAIFNGGLALSYDGSISGTGTTRLMNNTALTLTSPNSQGTTTIDVGSAVILSEGGSLAGSIVNNGNLTYDYDDTMVTASGTVSGTGTLTQGGTRSVLTIPNLGIGGGLTIAESSSAVAFGTGGALNGTLTSGIVNQGSLWFNHTGSIDLSGNLSGNGELSVGGAGTLTLAGANTYTGKTYVGVLGITSSGGGTLSISSDASLGAPPASFVADQLTMGDNTTLHLLAATTFAPTRGFAAHNAVTITGASLTALGGIGGTGTLNYNGTGTLTVGLTGPGSHAYSVGNLGTIAFDNLGASAFLVSPLSGVSGSTLRFQGAGTTSFSATATFAGTTEIASGSTLAASAPLGPTTHVLGTLALSSVGDNSASGFTGTGTILKKGSNTLTITQPAGSLTAFRGSLLLQSGVLALDSYAALGLEPATFRADGLTFDGGTLRITGELGGGTGANQGVTLTSSHGTVDLPGNNNFSLGGAFTGPGRLVKTGTGTLTVGAPGTFANDFQIVDGALRAASTGDQTFSGTISDNPTFGGAFHADRRGGAGNVIFTGNNTYTGGTRVSSGADLILGDGGMTGSVMGDIVATFQSAVRYNRSDSFTLPNTITGEGGLTQAGSGTLTINSAQAYTGTTKVSAGTLRLTDGASFAGALVTDATLALDYTTNQTVGNTISGTGGITKSGTTTTTLSAANSYAGPTKVDAGTLILTGANTGTGGGTIANGATVELADANGAAGGTFANAGTLALSRSGNYSLDLATTGAGTIEKTGSGNAYLTRAGDSANNISILAGNFGYDLADTETAILSGQITGPGKLLKAGAGTLVLTQNNNSANGATISQGTLQLGNNTATGFIAGPVTVADGATLAYKRSNGIAIADAFSGAGAFAQLGSGMIAITGDFTHTGGTTVGAGSTLQIGSNNITGSLGGNVSNNGTLLFDRSDAITFAGNTTGSGTLQQSGAGTLTLTGSHTATGGAIIDSGKSLALGTTAVLTGPVANSGNLTILTDPNAGDRALPVSVSGTGGVTIDGGGTLRIAGDLTYSGTTTIANATTLQLVNENTSTLHNVITGSGNFMKLGEGTLILTADSNLSGTVTVAQGTLQLGNNGITGSIGGAVSSSSIDLQGGTLAIKHSDPIVMNNVISGGGGLSQLGSGRLTLTNNNTFIGDVHVGANSELQLGLGGTTGSVVGHLAVDGLLYSTRLGDWGINLGLTGSGTISKVSSSDSITIAGGPGYPVNFTGTVSYLGGTVEVYTTGSLGTVTADQLYVGGGTNLALVGNNGALATVNNGTLTIGNGGATGTFSGAITGGGTLAFNRSDAFTFNGSIDTGTVHQLGTGTTTFSNTNHGFTGSIDIDAGNLVLNALVGGTVVNDGTLTLAYGRLDTGSTLTGSGKVVTASTGTTTLPNNASYTGETEIAGGVLELSPNGGTTTLGGLVSGPGGLRVATAGTVALGSGGTYTGATELVSNPRLKVGGGLVSDVSGSGTLEFNLTTGATASSDISGAIAVKKTGTATLTLSGANTHSGETRIESGTVRAGSSTAFSGNSSLVLANAFNALVDLANFDALVLMLNGGGTTGGHIDLGSGRLTVSPHTTFGTPLDGTYAGNITGSGGLTMNGHGTLTLTGTNGYTGGTSALGGTLAVAGSSSLGLGTLLLDGGTLRVDGNTTFGSTRPIQTGVQGGTLNVSDGITATIGSAITGTGTFFKFGAGTVLLNAPPTHSGLVQIHAGTLAIGSANMLTSSQLLVVDGHLDLNGHNWSTPLSVHGTGGVTNSNGTLSTLSGQLDTWGNLSLRSSGADLRVTGAITSTTGPVNLFTDGSGRVSLGATPSANVGDISVSNGTLAIENTSALTALDGFVISNRSQVELAGGSTTLAIDYLSFQGGSLAGDIGSLQNTVNGSTVRFDTTLSNGPFTFQGDSLAAVLLGGTGDLTFVGRAEGAASIAKIGTGRVTLEGNYADWTGGFDVRAGTLALDSTLLQGRALNIGVGGSLDLGSASGVSLAALTGNGTLALGTASLTLSGGDNFDFDGNVTTTGSITKGGTNAVTLNQTTAHSIVVDAGTATFDGSISANSLTVRAGDAYVTGSIAPGTLLRVAATDYNNTGGALHVAANRVTSNGGATFTGKLETNAAVEITGMTGSLTANAGSIVVNDAASWISGSNGYETVGSIAANSGTLAALNGANLSVASSFTNTGTVSVTGTNSALSVGFDSTSVLTQAAGSLAIGADAMVTVRALNVTGGSATLDGTYQYFGGGGRPALTVSGGELTGSGQIFRGNLTLEGGAFSPGNSPGTFTVSEGNATFAGGGSLVFEIDNANGIAGTNWDLLSISRLDPFNSVGGELNITATGTDRFTLLVMSQIGGDVAGPLANFNPTLDYSFIFASTTHGVSGFNANAFDIDVTGFDNPFGGQWSVGLFNDGNDLALIYSATAVPEPSTYAALFGVCALALAAWRKRRAA